MQSEQSVTVRQSRPWQVYALVALLIFVGVGALPAGFAFVLDPSGGLLGIPEGTLQSPLFVDFLVPGLFLFFVIGIGSVMAAVCLLWRPQWEWPERVNPFRHAQWEWALALAIGCILMVWIVVQLFSVTLDSFLQPLIFGIGVAIVALLWMPRVRGYYAR